MWSNRINFDLQRGKIEGVNELLVVAGTPGDGFIMLELCNFTHLND